MENLTTLLNKISAMKEGGFVSIAEIAGAINVTGDRARDIVSRGLIPDGKEQLFLHDFASRQTIRIALHPKMHRAYRSAFKKISARFPDEGR